MATLVAAERSTPSTPKAEAFRVWLFKHFFTNLCGITARDWWDVLRDNRFSIDLPYWPRAAVLTVGSVLNSAYRRREDREFRSRLDGVAIPPPLFILGHWRTGTTLLHELLILDERHGYPTTYECMAPHHFLLSEGFITRWLAFLAPKQRPMDNMAVGFDRPQEDEFALCMMGQPSPYLTIAFPNHPPQNQEALDLDGLPPRARRVWKEAFLRFLRHLTYRDPRRLVLKSPTHTCRIPALLELFPDARFVHIVRDPYVVFPSTVNLWKSLYLAHGLQRPTFAGLEEHVFDTFTHLYARLEASKHLLAPNRFVEIRYEDLIADPIAQMQGLYDKLELGGFAAYLPRLKTYLDASAGYRTNRYPDLDPALRAEIERRWGDVIRRYGYDRPGGTAD